MKTALVTGVSGYIGGHVAHRLLADGWRVVGMVRPESRLAPDLAERMIRADYDGTQGSVDAAFLRAPIDIVLHLASAVIAVHAPDQLDTIVDANIRLPTQLLEAMRAGACKRFINTGTFWQHCNSDNYAPVNLYAASKQAFEDLAKAYIANDGIHFCTLVLFDTYGADDPRRKIVRLLVEAIDAPAPLAMSPGAQILDLTHAADVAAAFVVAAEYLLRDRCEDQRFMVTGERLSLRDLVARVAQLAGRPPNVELGGRPYRDNEIMNPISSLPPLPGWRRNHSLDDEIRKMLSGPDRIR